MKKSKPKNRVVAQNEAAVIFSPDEIRVLMPREVIEGGDSPVPPHAYQCLLVAAFIDSPDLIELAQTKVDKLTDGIRANEKA
jgi:hypothetical protein